MLVWWSFVLYLIFYFSHACFLKGKAWSVGFKQLYYKDCKWLNFMMHRMEHWLKLYGYGRTILTRNLKVLRSAPSVTVWSILWIIAFHALLARPANTSSIQPACTSGSPLLTNQLAHCASLHSDLNCSNNDASIGYNISFVGKNTGRFS